MLLIVEFEICFECGMVDGIDEVLKWIEWDYICELGVV